MNNPELTDLDLFEQLLIRINQPYDTSETLDGSYDITCLSPETNGICIEFDSNKKFKKMERAL